VIVSRDEVFSGMFESEDSCIATERTASAFRQSLEQLVSDSTLGDRKSVRARNLAVREWSMDRMTSRYEALIRELTQTKKAND
jgi:hypothetical protein